MTTVISWLTAIRDAILSFLDMLAILQQIADNLSSATTGHVVGRRSYGQKKRIVKGSLQSSAIDEYSYEWVGQGQTNVTVDNSTGYYRLNGGSNAQWVIYLDYGERCQVKFNLFSDSEGATYSATLVSETALIGEASDDIATDPVEASFVHTSTGYNDYLVIDLLNQNEGEMLSFLLSVKVQPVVVNKMTEPEEDDYDKERFSFDLPMDKMEARVGNFFYDGEGWQISGNGSEIRSENQFLLIEPGMRMKEVRLALDVDVSGQLDIYLRYERLGTGTVGEIGARLSNGPLNWGSARPLRDMPFPEVYENQPFVSNGGVTVNGSQVGNGYRYELVFSNDSIYEAFESQIDGVNGFQLLFIGTSGSNQRITYGYWSVLMTSEPYVVVT